MRMTGEDISYSAAPAVLVIGSGPASLARAEAAVAAAGCRMLGPVDVGAAEERLELQASLAAALLEVDEDGGPTLDALLHRLSAGVEAGHYGAVVIAPRELTDVVAARAPNAIHLCEPTQAERITAIHTAGAPRAFRLNDIGAENRELRLRQLSDEVGRIAEVLARLSEGRAAAATSKGVDAPPQPPPEHDTGAVTAAEVRALIRARRLRDQFFTPELFADPAWDMLLDLYAARLEYKLVAVSSLCIAASVPPTTALRWIKTLTDTGLFIRRADPQDGRRVFIELSDAGADAMTGYMLQLRRLGAGVA